MLPLVSIGIPLPERVDGLSETIDSILAQSYERFEVVLVDNTAVEATQAAGRRETARDPRISYANTPGQFGVLPSHAEALAQSTGTYFMWLGVGDQLDPEFLSRCVKRLKERSDLSLAIGSSRLRGHDAPAISISAEDPKRRVADLLETEIGLDLWYGVFRRSTIAAIPFRNAVGFELALLSEIAFAGKMETVDGAWCERRHMSSGSSSAEETDEITGTLGMPTFQWEDPYLVLAVQLFCNIAFLSETFAKLPQIDRIRLAVRAYTKVVTRWTINDESRFISFAVRIYPEARITQKLHDLRLYLARALASDSDSKSLFEPLSRAEEIINGLGRMRIGRLPATQTERDLVKQFRARFDRSKSPAFRNRAVLALTMFV